MKLDPEIRRILKENFSLRENHLIILEYLFEKKSEKIDAETMSKETGVPLGRIYSFLEDLADYGFIGVQYTRPRFYYLKQPSEAFQSSITVLENTLADTQKKMLDYGAMLQKMFDSGQTGIPDVRMISKKEYHDIAYTIYLSSTILRAASTTSFLVDSEQFKDPYKRRLYSVFRKRLDANQIKAKYIFLWMFLKKQKQTAVLQKASWGFQKK